MKRLDDRFVSLERSLTTIQVTVEYLKHFLTNEDLKSNVAQHVMARQSPYPFTVLSRFPVFDKYVSWQVLYDSYDPPIITVDRSLFRTHELPLIDPDVLNLIELLPENIEVKLTQRFSVANLLLHKSDSIQEALSDSYQEDSKTGSLKVVAQLENLHDSTETSFLQTQTKIVEKWNKISAYMIGNKTCVIDRQSWITKNNKLIKYNHDTIGYPINPMGRTGTRGRGALWSKKV